jgi:hypothetical protein
MSMHQAAAPVRFRASAPGWLYARELWAGVSIVAMWLAVLFVGVYGGSINRTSADGSTSSVPVVVVVACAAFVATLVIGRTFKARGEDGDLRQALAEERAAREALAQEVAELARESPPAAG